MPEPTPRYDARTVETPDGETRITVAYKPGSEVEHMTDAEFLAVFSPEAMERTVTPVEPDSSRVTDTIVDLAEERLLRRTPGAPFTADELAPLFTGPHPHDTAALMALLINLVMDRAKRDYRP